MEEAIKRSRHLSLDDPNEIIGEIMGEKFRQYRRDWEAAEGGQRPGFPLHLDVDITCACNLSCPMCPAGNSGHIFPGFKKGQKLDEKLYSRALAEGREFGLPSLRLGLTGEPLLVNEINVRVDQARRAGVLDVSLITNGQLLSPSISAALIDGGLTRLMISIDAASEAAYARVRPGGDWGRLMNNIEAFLNYREKSGSRLPLLRLSFVEMTVNQAERDLFEKKFEGLADYLAFQKYQNILGAADTDFGLEELSASNPAAFCPEPFTRMALHADGGLFPCCSDFGRLRPLANIKNKGLAETWNSPEALALTGPGGASAEPCRTCLNRGLA